MTTPATLARFTSGGPPRNSLIIDASSDLYDTTGGGGMGGADTMFESSKGGALTILASFDCAGNNTLLIGNTIVDTAVHETRKKAQTPVDEDSILE